MTTQLIKQNEVTIKNYVENLNIESNNISLNCSTLKINDNENIMSMSIMWNKCVFSKDNKYINLDLQDDCNILNDKWTINRNKIWTGLSNTILKNDENGLMSETMYLEKMNGGFGIDVWTLWNGFIKINNGIFETINEIMWEEQQNLLYDGNYKIKINSLNEKKFFLTSNEINQNYYYFYKTYEDELTNYKKVKIYTETLWELLIGFYYEIECVWCDNTKNHFGVINYKYYIVNSEIIQISCSRNQKCNDCNMFDVEIWITTINNINTLNLFVHTQEGKNNRFRIMNKIMWI